MRLLRFTADSIADFVAAWSADWGSEDIALALFAIVMVAIGAAAIRESNRHTKAMLMNENEKAAAATLKSRCKTIVE